MKFFVSLIFFILLSANFLVVTAQSFTGGLRIVGTFTNYDETSLVLGDSIVDPNYSISSEIPGFTQLISLNAFGRIGSGNSSIILDVTNDPWMSAWNFPNENIQRFTFDWNNDQVGITLGDFYKSGIDVFMYSRPIRGLRFNSSHGERSNKWKVDIYGGEFAKPVDYQQKLYGQYRFFENGGVFRRWGGVAEASKNWNDFIETKLVALYAIDDENSIKASTVKPLKNIIIGGVLNSYLLAGKLNIGGGFWSSNLDSLAYATIQDRTFNPDPDNPGDQLDSMKTVGGKDFTTKLWMRYNWHSGKAEFQFFRVGSNYFTAGNPYLLADRLGFLLTGNQEILPKNLFIALDAEYFYNNLDNSPLYPQTTTIRIVPKLTVKFGKFDFTIGYPFQNEISDTSLQDLLPTVIDRNTTGPEFELNYSIGDMSVNYSAYLSLIDEGSILFGDSLFASRQQLHNLNIFLSNENYMISIGGAASLFDNDGETSNFDAYGIYGNSRITLVPGRFVIEANASWQRNAVDYINIWEKVGSFTQIDISAYLEYFISTSFSFKTGIQYLTKDYDYTVQDINSIISEDGFDYLYFQGQEDLNLLRPTIEFNILF